MVLTSPNQFVRPAGRAISNGRLWLFRLAAVVLGPVALLTVLEVSTRVTDIHTPTRFAARRQLEGELRIVNNPAFTQKYFGRRLARPSIPFSLPTPKEPGVFRIFILGGSAARGFPEPAFGIARQLEVLLESACPDTRFEVINAAITAINSHVVREIAEECAQLEPDLFVVYLGNNEVVGPYGPGTVFAPLSGSRSFIQLSTAFRSTGTAQLAERILGAFPAGGQRPQQWNGMEMFLRNQVPHDDERLVDMRRHFRANLTDICDAAQAAGIPVALCSVGVNERDCPPFGSSNASKLSADEAKQWTEHYSAGQRLRSAGQYRQALLEFAKAQQIDATHAGATYEAALCRWHAGDHEFAQTLFARARDLDTLRFRADSQINPIIRDVAECRRDRQVTFVDAEDTLRNHSPHRSPGHELFYEHVHLRFRGNYLIARCVLERVWDWLPGQSGTTPPVLANESECRRRLAFWPIEQRAALNTISTIISRPPFVGDLHTEQLRKTQQELALISSGLEGAPPDEILLGHRNAVTDRSHWMLHARYADLLFREARDLPAAEQQFHLALRSVPHSPDLNHQMAVVLAAHQRPEEAIPFFEEALSSALESPSIALNAARTFASLGDFARAASLARTAESLLPQQAAVHLVWADLHTKRGDLASAIKSYQSALELAPDDSAAQLALGLVLVANGDRAQALEQLLQARESARKSGNGHIASEAQRQIDLLNS